MNKQSLSISRWFAGLVIFLSLIAAHPSQAHDDGQSIEREVGDYLVDVGYDPTSFKVGQPIQFDFAIFTQDLAKKPQPDYQSVHVSVSTAEKGLFYEAWLDHQDPDPSAMTLTFPEAGAYQMDVEFLNAGKSIVEQQTFTWNVDGVNSQRTLPTTTLLGGLLLGIALGGGLASFWLKR